ncbi:hypothetical protein Gpo141_00012752 [Globisporangium polare]
MGSVFSSCSTRLCVNDDAHSNPATAVAPVLNTRTTPDPVQPELNASEWLLSESEITAFRGGHERSDLHASSQGNAFVLYPSSDKAFAAMFLDMEAATGPDDWIWIAGWGLSIDTPLVAGTGSKEEAAATSLERILTRAVLQRGVHVRVLLWASMFQTDEMVQARDWLNALAPPPALGAMVDLGSEPRGSCLCLFDDRLPHYSSAHHQKIVIVKRQDRLVAYVGGLDLTHDRWDTIAHDQSVLRRERSVFAEFEGWIDAHSRLEGPAVQDVAATFSARWNSKKLPCVDLNDKVLKFQNPPNVRNVVPVMSSKAPPSPSSPSVSDNEADTSRTCHVQIVRTFSPHLPGMYPEFAPQGELSLLHARIKAIRAARNFIYIEDQYFFFMPQLMDALLDVLPHLLRVVVVVQRPTVTTESRVAGYEKLLFQMANPLLHQFPTKFKLYTTREKLGLYIHAKVLIVDDVFVSIGSSNWNRRSMTSDSEIAANFVDTDALVAVSVNHPNQNQSPNQPQQQQQQIKVGKLVRRFRLEKFAEKLASKVTVEELDKMGIVESCELLESAAKDESALLEVVEVDAKWEFALFPPTYTRMVVDPDDLNGDEADTLGEALSK